MISLKFSFSGSTAVILLILAASGEKSFLSSVEMSVQAQQTLNTGRL